MNFFKQLTETNKLALGFGICVLLLVVALSISVSTSVALFQNISRVERTTKIISKLENIAYDLSRCESQARGYLINSRQDVLDQYRATLQKVYQNIDSVQHLSSLNAMESDRLAKMRGFVDKRVSILNNLIELKNESENNLQVLKYKVGEGEVLTDVINTIKKDFIYEQQSELWNAQHDSKETLRRTKYLLSVTGLLSIVVGVMTIFIITQDIKKRKAIEEELRKLNENKNLFFSAISHDLRGPIRAMMNLSSFISKNKLQANDQEEINKMIELSAKRVNVLLDNLLQWSKLQMDHVDFKPQKLNINDLVKENFDMISLQALEKKIQLVNDVKDEVTVTADKNMLDSVLRNLLSNAVKFTRTDGAVVVSAIKNNGKITISIKDNGVGMPQEIVEKLFNQTSKGLFTTKGTSNEEGSGLGLFLCKHFLEKNKGNLSVKSKLNEGTTFNIELPSN